MTANIRDQGLVIVPAGAGAGKTHRIKTTLSEWVAKGLVRPERILAVTFTEAAASELRERIRAGLLEAGLVKEALAVERAYISTIHALGLRLLTEHALAAGASPQPRVINDAEKDLLIRQTLSMTSALDPIKADPERFGYAAQRNNASEEDTLRGRVLHMIDLLRGIGDKGRDPDLIDAAVERIEALYGDVLTEQEAQAAKDALVDAVAAMLDQFPKGGMSTVSADSPLAQLRKDLNCFREVRRSPDMLDRNWRLWKNLRKVFVSNSKSKTPEGYDELAERIREAADVLPRLPGPREDAKLHLRCLIACAQEVMDAYARRKRDLGLIDYADMIAEAERLLREDEMVRKAVLDEIDCVIIDEFQDTNPVQFAFLWQLGKHAPRTLLVGDVKQSIMRFQGADPRLSTALAATYPESVEPLDRNWRSTPAVMAFVNALGRGLFGDGYNSLTPTREDVDGPALEVLHLKTGRGGNTRKSRPPEHVAERISEILRNGEMVTDRHSGLPRPVRPSDIAILVYRHNTADRYAAELRNRGIPVRKAEDGWSGSTVVQVARAALAYAANPADIHAGLMLRVLGPEPLDLQDALARQMDGQLQNDPLLKQLAALADELTCLPVTAALDRVFEVAGLRTWAVRQPDAAQARANLLRLEAEAEAFETAHRDLKAASGINGESIKAFLGWLEARKQEKDFDRCPDPSADSAEAVEIVTWHASKGREWPITVVAELDEKIEEKPGTSSIEFQSLERIDNMAEVLNSAMIIHTPEFAAEEAQRRFIEDRREDFEANARNLLYVAMTRARDRLILERPGFLKRKKETGGKADRLFHVFEDFCKPEWEGEKLRLGDVVLPVRMHVLPDYASTTLSGVQVAGGWSWFGGDAPLPPMSRTPWRLSPSQLSDRGSAPVSRSVTLGEAWPQTANDAFRGSALHLAMHTYLVRPDLAGALPAVTGLDDAVLGRVEQRAGSLKDWLASAGYTDLRCEVRADGRTPEGTEITAVIDLIALGPDGCLVIDHKSGGEGQGVGSYWSQLEAYAHILADVFPKHPVRGAAICWLDHGTLELVDLAGVQAEPLRRTG